MRGREAGYRALLYALAAPSMDDALDVAAAWAGEDRAALRALGQDPCESACARERHLQLVVDPILRSA